MINVDEVLISEDILEEQFCCNLSKCKGACCIEGDYGAPLEEQEKNLLKKSYEFAKKYLPKESIKEIKKQGLFTKDENDELVTPIFGKNGRCVYVYFDNHNEAKCSLEKVYLEKKTYWKKPISCYLYPIRINKLSNKVEALNYHKWDICSDACELGKNLKLPLYKFLKEPLIEKYGEDWYNSLTKL